MTDLADAPVSTDAETSKVNAALAACSRPTTRGRRTPSSSVAHASMPDWRGWSSRRPRWPGARPELNRVVEQGLREAGAAPTDPRTFFMELAGPTIVTHGSEELKQRLLRPMFTGEEIWCQLFSEPGAGSDVAGLAPGPSGRRRVDRQRTEGVEHPGPPRRLGMLVTRTDPELQAQGADVLRRRHARARCRGAAAAPDHRRGRVQRGLSHRCPGPGPTASAMWARAGGSPTTLMNERGRSAGAPAGSVGVGGAAKTPSTCGASSPSPSASGVRRARLMRLWCGRGPAAHQHAGRGEREGRQPRSGDRSPSCHPS